MSLEQRLLQLIATGISNGSIYALLGLGLVVVYSTTRIVNVAIGEFATFGALITVSLLAAGVPFPAAVVAAVAGVTLLSLGVHRVALQPARERGASGLTMLIITIALHLALKGVALILWGTRSYTVPPFTEGTVRISLAILQKQHLWILGLTALVMLALWLGFTRTVRGRALRAAAVNPMGARLMGIPVMAVGAAAFALSGGLAALSGVMITPLSLATYDMGFVLGLKGFVGAIMGGLVNYPLTVVGCLFLGVAEALAAGLLPSGYRDAVAFVLLIAVLIWRALPALRHGVLFSEEAVRE
ncbi:MAG TPA: branched-chain amino acid ABC transporter permease [Bacillota bacterium]